MIKKQFRFRIFLICFLPVVLRRQRLQSEIIANALEVRRRRDSRWSSIRNKILCDVVKKFEVGGCIQPMFGFIVQKECKGIIELNKTSRTIVKFQLNGDEQTCVKQLASLNEMPNHPSKIVLQER